MRPVPDNYVALHVGKEQVHRMGVVVSLALTRARHAMEV